MTPFLVLSIDISHTRKRGFIMSHPFLYIEDCIKIYVIRLDRMVWGNYD
jgi:hypothetical protein